MMNEEQFYQNYLRSLLVQRPQAGRAAPIPKPKPSLAQGEMELARIMEAAAPRPMPPSGPSKRVLQQAVKQGQQPQGPQMAQNSPLAALQALMGQNSPNGLGGLMSAQAASTASLANMIASGGASPFAETGQILHARRQQQIENMSGLQTLQNEIRGTALKEQELALDKVKLAYERGNATAETILDIWNQFGKDLEDVPDKAERASGFMTEAMQALELMQPDSPEGVVRVLAPITQKWSKGAIAEKKPLVQISDETESEFGKGVGKSASERYSIIRDAGTSAGATSVNLNQMYDLIQSGLETGKLEDAISGLQAWAGDFGVDLSGALQRVFGANAALSDISDKQEFDRLSTQIIIDGFEKFKGNLNAKEVQLAINAFQNLGRTTEANKRAIASGLAATELAQKRAVEASKHRTNTQEFEKWENSVLEGGSDEFSKLRDFYINELVLRDVAKVNAAQSVEDLLIYQGKTKDLPPEVREALKAKLRELGIMVK